MDKQELKERVKWYLFKNEYLELDFKPEYKENNKQFGTADFKKGKKEWPDKFEIPINDEENDKAFTLIRTREEIEDMFRMEK